CLAISADPLPGAWVRLVALERNVNNYRHSFLQLAAMFDDVLDALVAQGVEIVGWMAPITWPLDWPEKLGFHLKEEIITYQKPTFALPRLNHVEGLIIRSGTASDAEELEAVEARTFEPLWRHSALGLIQAMKQAFSFDVAELNGKIVGFQHSAQSRGAAVHLARITVDPSCQSIGIGSQLLAHAIQGYQLRGAINMTLNTESSNKGAQALYKRFFYKPNDHRFPLYAMELD
ncbi:MAG: GNAT family N-acetyltransferase, partial [Chloroflexota bacterium]